MNKLEGLPIDLFIKQITYLPFDDVVSICNTNLNTRNYCTNSHYNTHWKSLVINTFGIIDDYEGKIKQIQDDLGYDSTKYDYLVYTQLVKLLDPITQVMIYYRQGDMKSFDSDKFNNMQRFLALFLLNDKVNIKKYLPNENYQPFIDLLNGKNIPYEILHTMLLTMALQGSLQGVKYFEKLGSNIHVDDDYALKLASENGHLDIVKYLIEHGADVHSDDDYPMIMASAKGYLDVVKYLVENGANVRGHNNAAIILARKYRHIDIARYLIEKGANAHAHHDFNQLP